MPQSKQDNTGRTRAGSRTPKPGPRFYDRVLTQEEIAALSDLANNPSLTDEIALLKVLIRRKLEEGTDLATISKAVDALGRALKVQKQISSESHQALQDALLAVLTELGEERRETRGRGDRETRRRGDGETRGHGDAGTG
jgi:hypothetical protein